MEGEPADEPAGRQPVRGGTARLDRGSQLVREPLGEDSFNAIREAPALDDGTAPTDRGLDSRCRPSRDVVAVMSLAFRRLTCPFR